MNVGGIILNNLVNKGSLLQGFPLTTRVLNVLTKGNMARNSSTPRATVHVRCQCNILYIAVFIGVI